MCSLILLVVARVLKELRTAKITNTCIQGLPSCILAVKDGRQKGLASTLPSHSLTPPLHLPLRISTAKITDNFSKPFKV